MPTLLALIPYVLAVFPSTWLIEALLKLTPLTPNQRELIRHHLPLSRWIGVFERWLVIFFLWQGEWSAVGFIVAAKGLLRLPDIRQDDNPSDMSYVFSSYILLGTLMSFSLAILLGIGFHYLYLRSTLP